MKFNCWALILFSFLNNPLALAQKQSVIDSLEKIVSTSEKETKVNALNKLAETYVKTDFKKAEDFSNKAIKMAIEISFCRGQAKGIFLQANAFFFHNDHKRCIDLCQLSAQKAIACKDWELACQNFEAMAAIYITLWQDYPKSLEYYSKSLQIYELYFPEGKIYNPIIGIAKVYLSQNDFVRSSEYFEKAQSVIRPNDESGLQLLYANLGDLNFAEKKYSEAEINLLKAYASYQTSNSIGGLITCCVDLANVYRALNNFTAALKYGEEALKLSQQMNQYDRARMYGIQSLGKTYLALSDFKKAKDYFVETVSIASRLNMIEELKESYESLAIISQALGNYQEALRYERLHAAFADSVMNKQKAREISKLEVQLETEKKEREIQLLERDKQMSQLNTAATIAALLGVIILAISIISGQRIKNKKERELAEMQQRVLQERTTRIEAELKSNQLKEEQLAKELDFKTKELTTTALNLIQKNETLENLKRSVEEIKQLPQEEIRAKLNILVNAVNFSFHLDRDWNSFRLHFDQVHQGFFNKLIKQFPDLTGNDLKICALMRLNLDTKEMATILDISAESTKVARHRLRKKLNITPDQNLSSFLATF